MEVTWYSKHEVDEKIDRATDMLLEAQNQLAADVMNVGVAREIINAVRISLERPIVQTEMNYDDGAWAAKMLENSNG